SLEVEVPSQEVQVFADAERIGQVVNNYLSNALKYSESDCPVKVYVMQAGNMARVEVIDEGPGLLFDQQAHIWQRFYRVPGIEVKSGSGVGLGLGLHICKTIIERQAGEVGVESAPGQGSTFWFTLPLAEPVQDVVE
ncbi:MAG TPA: ATP-binding protein, partial [Ktedonobacteraceae bacterium]|nr:ATP-binding protein [Ktedonobacteraceae bacterium]